jgi:hypothetical protein
MDIEHTQQPRKAGFPHRSSKLRGMRSLMRFKKGEP